MVLHLDRVSRQADRGEHEPGTFTFTGHFAPTGHYLADDFDRSGQHRQHH
ncbi:hypothetical protein [Streptomyces sp. SPB162]|nr:hypothetical protein [Streptomyces sp. SPB162]